MGQQLEVTWTDEVAAPPEAVGDAITRHGWLGVRSTHGLHRIYGRDRWGWPVSVAHHLFDPAADGAAVEQAWRALLGGLYERETV